MMKMKCFVLLATLFLFSCADNEKKGADKSNKPADPPGEQALINDVEKYPDSAVLLEKLMQYYSDGENFDKAIATLNKVLAKDSTNARLWDIKSAFYLQKQDTIQAEKSLEAAIALRPEPQYIIGLGALYAQTKNPLALSMADALLIGDKAHAEKEAYFIKGLYYSFNNEKEKAIPFFDKCIALQYTFMDAYLEKAIALYDMAKYQESTAVLERAVTIQNSFDKGYFYLGKAYEKLNRRDDAAEAYRTALLYDPEYAEAKDALGRLQ